MPADASISNKTYRVLSLLQALPRAPRGMTSKELLRVLQTQGHAIDVRTVERYLKELLESETFGAMIRCNDVSRPYAWSISTEKAFSLPGMDERMAATLDLVSRYLKPLMPRDVLDRLQPYFNEAHGWLKRHKPAGKKMWMDKVAYVPRGLSLQPAKVSLLIADQVFDALYQNRQMKIWYKDKTEPKLVNPLALVDRGAVRYLIVRFEGYDNYRHLALQRLKRVQLLDEQVQGGDAFDLEDYLREGSMNLPYGETIDLKLRFYGRAGDHLYETPINEQQQLTRESDGTVILNTELASTEELRWWILGFGSQVEVLAPAELREVVAADVQAAGQRYKL